MPASIPPFQLQTKFVKSAKDWTVAGDVSYTGVGFKPKFLIFFGGKDGAVSSSIGASDAAKTNANWVKIAGGASYAENNIVFAYLADLSNRLEATLKSIDDDGFTLTWTKTGSPTGSGNMHYLCVGGGS